MKLGILVSVMLTYISKLILSVFGWPDLYDTDDSSAGIGSWCLMSAGSWGGGGLRPVHPSACEFIMCGIQL